ncbi:hypothetical protein IEO21_03654 [Rhodonia placenta]|uniref:Uncharacterized protein n=1 Tax=Rhodonia placenta TaxID=104341 RepID=A0A8H7P5F6_9APHY|nr:hypothetical protein IEO21_03654 [Postia placenta]
MPSNTKGSPCTPPCPSLELFYRSLVSPSNVRIH